jgi:HK97 family phage major capsid protein
MTSTSRALRQLPPAQQRKNEIDYRDRILPPMPHHEDRGRHQYSLVRALAQVAEGKPITGLEAEVSQELERIRGRRAKGLYVPFDAPVERRGTLGFGSGSAFSGSASAQVTIPDGMAIDQLRPKLVVERLGGQILNLTPEIHSGGGVRVPTTQTAATISWTDEGQAPAQSNAVINSATLTPHTAMAFTDVTRRQLSLGQPGFEGFVIDQLFTGLAVAIDTAAIAGTGTSFQPLGLLSQINSAMVFTCASDTGNGGAPAASDLLALEAQVGLANGDAPADARVGWLTSPAGRRKLRQVSRFATAAVPVWESHSDFNQTGQLVTVESCFGFPAVSSTLIPQNVTRGSGTGLTTVVTGNFTELVVNLFTEFDVLVNPYLQSQTGVVRISVFVDVDSVVRRPGAFAELVGVNPA